MGSRASLNHIYRTVWNQALGAMVAVAEVASGRGKSSCSGAASAGRANLLQSDVARIGLSALAVACAWGSLATSAQANPNGGVAIHGQATQTTNGNRLLVTTQNGAGSNHSAINWQSFSIPGGSSTYFQQPGVSSTVINRVVTNTPSLIFGTLGSNGNVVLVNQSGITVGAGALVDTAGFTASALRMTDADAIAGRLRFGDGTAPVGGVSVQGSILARSGDVVLIGSNVDTGQSALVQSPNGSTVLAAGRQIEITGRGLEGIFMLVQAPADSAVNLGTLNGDAVGIFAGTLKTAGAIAATAVTAEGGKVFLKAADTTEISGSVSGKALNGLGGAVHATADKIVVKAGAQIDVSGQNGGGEALIGGGYQGKDARLANARRTLVEAGATINADAIGSGNGGTAVVWSDEATRYLGHISARGGALGGDGGLAEVSGKEYLDFRGTADLRADAGREGILLLDPLNLTIGNEADVDGYGGDVTGDIFAGNFSGLESQITAEMVSILLSSADLSLAATGNITVSSSINKASGSTRTFLRLTAGSDIVVESSIGSTSASGLDVYLDAQFGTVTTTGATISTNGGLVDISGYGGIVTGPISTGVGGVDLQSSLGSVDTTGGAISTANGDVNMTASGSITTGVISTLGGDVDLNSNNGAVNAAAMIFTSGGGVGISARDNVSVSQILAGVGDVVLSSSQGNISQFGAIIANKLTVDAGEYDDFNDVIYGGAITLTAPTNNIAILDGYGTSITLSNTSSSLRILKAHAWDGTVSITNSGGIIIEDYEFGSTVKAEPFVFGNQVLESLATLETFAALSSPPASVTLTSTNGAITTSATSNPAIFSDSVSLNAKEGIGSVANPITVANNFDPINVEFVNTTGDAHITGSADLNVLASQSGGSINLEANNNLNIYGNLTASTGNIVLVAGAGDGNIDLDAGEVGTFLSAGANVAISSQGVIDATGFSKITAQTLTTSSSGGTYLTGDGDALLNRVGTFSATDTGGGDIFFANSGAFSLGTISTTGSGRFVIYADTPESVTKNGVTSSFRHYGATYAALSAAEVPLASGNGFVYASTPTSASISTYVAAGPATHEYAQSPNVVFGYTVAGVDLEDIQEISAGTLAFDLQPNITTDAGTYQIGYTGGLTFGPNAYVGLGSPATSFLLPVTAGASTTYTVTPRAQSNWQGSITGLWSDANNWDVTPTLANVLAVNIPVGVSVEFDAAAGSTSLQSLNSPGLLSVTGGALDVASSLVAGQYTQTGGAVTGDGAFTVTDSFTQTGGAIAMKGAVSITQASGDLTVGSVTGGSVSLDAKTGSILQTASITSIGLLKTSSVGSTTLDNVFNSVGSFNATISGAGDLVFTNKGAVDVTGITIPNGDLTIDQTGGLKTSGAIEVPNGDVSIITRSPMVIGSTVNAGGDIVLAALTPDGSSNITINGAMTSTSGGISVQAYNNFIQNSNLSAAFAIDIAAGGTLTFGPSAFSVGNPVSYTVNGVTYAPPWVASTLSGGPTSFVDNFLGQFETALNSQNFDVDDPLGLRERSKEGVVVEGDICPR